MRSPFFLIILTVAMFCLLLGRLEAQTYPAPNIPSQFGTMKHHGVAMGFHMGNATFDPDSTDHWQGVARYHTPNGGIPYLFVTRKDGETMGNLCVVQMPSRTRTGERFRSNRLRGGRDVADTAPVESDKIVRTITFDNVATVGHYVHPGGIQISNNLLVVALEDPHGASDNGALAFFDISDPRNPQHLVTDPLDFNADIGQVALIKQSNGTLLVAVCGWDNATKIRFYETTENAVRNPPADRRVCTLLDEWTNIELGADAVHWNLGPFSLQSLNFLRDSADGRLYLTGTYNTTGGSVGEDHAQLWRVDKVGGQYQLHFIQDRHLFASDSNSGNYADGAAASGAYVSPSGQLIYYLTEHDNDGPNGSVKFGEWTNARFNWQGNIFDPTTGWVELYDDDNGWNDGTPDRSIVFDATDRAKDNLENFNYLEGFNDKGSSVRWCLPLGMSAVLYQNDSFGGRTLTLAGTGHLEQIANLGDRNFGDETSSLRFFGFDDLKFDVTVVPEVNASISGALGTLGTRSPTVLSIRGGAYAAPQIISQPVRLEAREGTVIIAPP